MIWFMTLPLDPTGPAQYQGATAVGLSRRAISTALHTVYASKIPGAVSHSSASKESQGRVHGITT